MAVEAAIVPVAGRVVTSALSLMTISVLAVCLVRRLQFVRKWSTLPIVSWTILVIYIDSFLFIFTTAVLEKSWSINSSTGLCQTAILLCLACYMSTKIAIYYFLVEKVYIVRGSTTRRMSNKLWKFNVFGLILLFAVLVMINIVYRIGFINDKGVCIIGIKKQVLFPLIGFDVIINIYLTALFLAPLRQLYSFKASSNPALRTVAFRTFVGSCTTLCSSVTNLTVLAILHGEPGWICLLLCNLDILFSVLVLHWATSVDRQTSSVLDTDYNDARPSMYGARTVSARKSCMREPTAGEGPDGPTISIKLASDPHRITSDREEDIELGGIRVQTVRVHEDEVNRNVPSEHSGSEDGIIRPLT